MVKDENGKEHYVGLRMHDLRHSAVALWIAAGASPNEIAARAGHTQSRLSWTATGISCPAPKTA